MSNQDNSNGSDELRPQVVVMEKPQHSDAGVAEPLAPRLIATAQTGRIVPVPPVEPPPAAAAPGGRQRYSLTMKLGLAGLIAAFCGWLGVDLYLWVASAFNFSTGLGWAATAAAVAGVAAAGTLIAHEMRGYLALKPAALSGAMGQYAAFRYAGSDPGRDYGDPQGSRGQGRD